MTTSSSDKSAGISGKKATLIVYGIPLLMCAALLWYGLSIRGTRDNPPLSAEDRALLAELPQEWTRITNVEGQGWAIYIPCQAEAGTLKIEADSVNPRLTCAWCDTVQEGEIARVSLRGQMPRATRLKLDGGAVALIEPVDAVVAARFFGAPLYKYVLTWTQADGAEMFFVPTEDARNFETLKADDESSEGCLGSEQ